MRAAGNMHRLIESIIDGARRDPPWSEFVALLREQLGCIYANLIFRRAGESLNDAIEVWSGERPDWVPAQYRTDFGSADPIPYFQMPALKAFTYQDLVGFGDAERERERDRFREDFLKPAGFEHLLIFRVAGERSANLWVTVVRQQGGALFCEDDRAMCAQLAKHLASALSCYCEIVRLKLACSMYQRAANTLAFGVISLDGEGGIVSVDAAAQHSLGNGELQISNGRLRGERDDARLQSALRTALESGDVQSCHLGHTEGLDLLIVPVARQADLPGTGPKLSVYISRRGHGGAHSAERLAQMFGLSQRQARLALLLANGQTLAEAARSIGITEQTARSYSKDIFQLTGTSRQGELISHILTSVAMLA